MSQDEALNWFAELFGIPSATLSLETRRTAIPTWDSLGVLTLMGALDETFGVVVNDADMRAMTKVGDVFDLLRAHGKLV